MLLFLDGCAHYDTSRIGMKYSTLSTNACTWAVTPEGRFGNCIKRVSINNSFPGGYLGVSPLMTRSGIWTPTNSGVCGFAVKVDDVGKASSDIAAYPLGSNSGLVVIHEGSTQHLMLGLNQDGTFTLTRYANAGGGALPILAQSTEGLASGSWMFVECKWVISNTAGSFELRVNGVTIINYHGRTQESELGNTLGVWNLLRVAGVNHSGPLPYLTMRICDLYVADLTAPLPDDVHDFLGDGTIATIFPNAPGDSAGWAPSSGANWDAVNDRPLPDDDATYVSALSPGVADLYNFDNIPGGALVKAAHLNILARKETEGSAMVAPLVQPPGSGPLTGPAQGVASLAYDRYLTQPYDLNPATNVKFTSADINNGQFGVVKTT